MSERRQAFRREPIEIDFGGDIIISIGPVSWLKRNDFGNEVMRQHTEILNEAVQIYIEDSSDTAIPRLETKFADKFNDPIRLFEFGLDEETFVKIKAMAGDLDFPQIVAILLAICDVNQLYQLKPLLDPNSLTPTPLGGLISTMTSGEDVTPKTESSPDSSSPELTEVSSTS